MKKEQSRRITTFLKENKLTNREKLRLVLLYSIRYEGDAKATELRDLLYTIDFPKERIKLIDYLIEFGGRQKRQGDLFHNKTFKKQMFSFTKQLFNAIPSFI